MLESTTLDDASAANATAGLERLRSGAGWMPLRETGWIAVTGQDRVRWLNGMVTNSVQSLAPGDGCYTFLLNAQGRIQGDATVWAEPDRLLLETGLAQVQPLTDLLDHFIIMDDVELSTLPRYGAAVAGPAAAALLQAAGLAVPAESLRVSNAEWSGEPVSLVSAYGPAMPRFEVWFAEESTASAFTRALGQGAEISAGAFELLRILEERPLYGVDLHDRDLPQETAQTRALHFNKGCYLGQEIVERIRSRGQVHRTFSSFTLHGGSPAPGAELLADGKPAGLLTSVATAAIDGKTLALGFVRREAIERGQPLQYAGGTAEARARPAASKQ